MKENIWKIALSRQGKSARYSEKMGNGAWEKRTTKAKHIARKMDKGLWKSAACCRKNGLYSKGKYPRKRQDHGRQLAPLFGEVAVQVKACLVAHELYLSHHRKPHPGNMQHRRLTIMGTAYGYVRVSTQEQKVDRQLLAMRQKGIGEERIFIDRASGRDFNRPRYRALAQRQPRDNPRPH